MFPQSERKKKVDKMTYVIISTFLFILIIYSCYLNNLLDHVQ